jgi:adenine-specific DNA-methyltransferase
MSPLNQKESGAYFTPDHVARSLLSWAIRSERERLLDPSCGDGRFIAGHKNSVGIEQDPTSARSAVANAPWALVHEGDFFAWASNTEERFECAAGNPPFIRFQSFKGAVRERALSLCAQLGARFSGLTSSWAPFLVATASLLLPGGRMAFVVPAEIGHAPYAAPLLEYLLENFGVVHVVAVRDKLFPELSEDCWLLYAEGFGAKTTEIRFTALDAFRPFAKPPSKYERVTVTEWRTRWRRRLRPFVLGRKARSLYAEMAEAQESRRFGDVAQIGIGYVTGANEFFHLRPSEAARLKIPASLLHPTVRNGRVLPARRLTASMLGQWRRDDEPMLLLRLPKHGRLPSSVERYLDSERGHEARGAYKCRVREPWYSVPDVQTPDFFLTYMSGLEPGLVRNEAGATCTNSIHSVRLKKDVKEAALSELWDSPLVKLSCELEGHPLGGGMLKLEPREAAQIVLPGKELVQEANEVLLGEALATMREWRHYASMQ